MELPYLIFYLSVCLVVSGSSANPPLLPDPESLFHKFLTQLPGVLKTGYQKSGIIPLDPWNTDQLYYGINYPNGNLLRLRFVNATLIGFTEEAYANVNVTRNTELDYVTANYLSEANALTFVGEFEGTARINGESTIFKGNLDLSIKNYQRNLSYVLFPAYKSYVLNFIGLRGVKYGGVIALAVDMEQGPVKDLITSDAVTFSKGLFDNINIRRMQREFDLCQELLTRIQNINITT